MNQDNVRGSLRVCVGAVFAVVIATTAAVDLQAQTGAISGRVTNQDTGGPVVTAQLSVQGTMLGTVSGTDGSYSIPNVPAGTRTLIVQRIGFQEVTLPDITVSAGQAAVVDVVLSPRILMMEAIVATGLIDPVEGARSPITIGRVDRQNIPVPVAGSMIQNLQGQISGVSVARGSGEPGTSAQIQLRSPTNLGAGTPLIVVDGVILGAQSQGLEAMDIESIEVVKGAAASSLYGSRAANGVIAITTRRGSDLAQGQTQFSYRSEYGWQSAIEGLRLPTHHFYRVDDPDNPTTYLDAEGNPTNRLGRVSETANPALQFMDNAYPEPIFDNINNVWDPGTFQQHTFSVAQNTADTNFMVSLNRNVQEGALPNNNGYNRNSFRVNLDHRFLNTLSLGISAYHSRDYRDDVNGSLTDLYSAPPEIDLTAPPVTAADSLGGFVHAPDPLSDFENPLWVEGVIEDEQRRARTLGSAQLRWEPAPWVSFMGNVSYDREDEKTRNYTPKGTPNVDGAPDDGSLTYDQDLSDTWNAEVQASLRRDFGPLNVRTTIRGLLERDRNESITASGSELAIANTPTLEAVPSSAQSSGSSESEIRADGYLADTALDYDGKYIGTFLVRRDGSSLFGKDERWQTYYRAAAAWRLSEEEWFNVPNVQEFKLTYSRGTAGGRPDFDAQYEVWSLSNGVPTKNQLGNRDLRPEKTTEQEVSLAMVLYDRWSVELAHAWQRTEDQLVEATLLAISGYGSQWQNGGTISGNTTELSVNGQIVQRANFGWTTTIVGDRTDAKIEEWPFACQSPSWRYRCEGRGVYEIWGNRFLEDPSELAEHRGGDVVAEGRQEEFDVNEDGLLVWVGAGNTHEDGAGPDGVLGTGDDLWGTETSIGGRTYAWGIPFWQQDEAFANVRQQIGDGKFMNLGWINNFNFGAFSVHTQLHAKVGGDAQNTQHQYMINSGNTAPMQDQAGRPTGLKKPIAYWSALYAGAAGSNYFNEDGSFVKLRAVSLNYRLTPSQLARFGLSNVGITSLTLGLIGRDLYTWTNYRGWDPEQGVSLAGGSQTGAGGTYPPTSSYTLEFGLTF